MQSDSFRKSQIFIDNVTSLDCALFFPDSGPRGESWRVDVMWEGKQDDNGFIFDFSLAKKLAKQCIDKEFDHKIFVQEENIKEKNASRILVAGPCLSEHGPSFFALNAETSTIKIISSRTLSDLQKNITSSLEQEIARFILISAPSHIENIIIRLRKKEQTAIKNSFTYLHSLPRHFGNCQRFHGHSGLIEIYRNGKINREDCEQSAKEINELYLIFKDYVRENWNCSSLKTLLAHCPENIRNKDHLIAIEYQGNQGFVSLVLPKDRVLALSCESTVENIAAHIRKRFTADEHIEVRCFEGICKGAVCS